MSTATPPRFVYVTYIRATAEELWIALTQPEFVRSYWFGVTPETTWAPGSSWRLVFEDGTVADAGEILEAEPPRRLVIRWRNEFRPELKAEGWSRCTMEIEPQDGSVRLTVTHTMEEPQGGAKFIEAVGGGWPMILASLKSRLETGTALGRPAG